MSVTVRICPVCKVPLGPGDFVASKYPNGLVRKIEKYDKNREGEKWYHAGNTMSNTHFFRCHNCGANVQIQTFERVTEVK